MEASVSYLRQELKSVVQNLFTCAKNGEKEESPTFCFWLSERKKLEEQLKEKEKLQELKKKEEEKELMDELRNLFREGKDESDPLVKMLKEKQKSLFTMLGSSQLGAEQVQLFLERVEEVVKDVRERVEELGKDVRELTTAKKPLTRRFSSVGSGEAEALLMELEFDEINGNALFPIEVPSNAPQCAEFNFAAYPSENAGTPDLLKHHKIELSKFGVQFGRGGFEVFNLGKQNAFSFLSSTGQLYRGAVDGAIAPYGLATGGATRQLRICYEHKQTEWQKAEYRRLHPDQFEGCMEEEQTPDAELATRSVQFAGGDRGQAIAELLAAYASNSFPLLLDLTDGKVHHLLSLTGSALVSWENLTPREAYYKQSQVLTSSLQAPILHLRLKDVPEEDSLPLKKMRKYLPQNGLLEQLSCLADLPVDTRVETALELFHTWSHITPPPLPLPEVVANFYS